MTFPSSAGLAGNLGQDVVISGYDDSTPCILENALSNNRDGR